MRIHPLVGLLIVVSLALAVWRANSAGGVSPYSAGFAVGQWLGSMMVSAIVAIIGYFVARRSTAVFNIAFALVASLLVIANLLTLARGSGAVSGADLAAVRQLDRDMSDAKAEIRDKMRADDAPGAKAATDKALAAMDRASATLKGDAALITRAGADAARYLAAVVEPFDKASSEFQALGGIGAGGLTADVVNRRLDALGKAKRAHDALRLELGKMKDWFEHRCRELGVSEKGSREAAAGFVSGGKLTSLIRMHEETSKLLGLFRELLIHLRDSQERWRLTQGGTIAFDDDEDAEKYNQILGRVKAAAAKESEFQNQALGK